MSEKETLAELLRVVERAQLEIASGMDMRPEDTANYFYAEVCHRAADHIDALTSQVKAGADEIEKMREALRQGVAFADLVVRELLTGQVSMKDVYGFDIEFARALSRPAPEAREKDTPHREAGDE
jgi:hypothetical protein